MMLMLSIYSWKDPHICSDVCSSWRDAAVRVGLPRRYRRQGTSLFSRHSKHSYILFFSCSCCIACKGGVRVRNPVLHIMIIIRIRICDVAMSEATAQHVLPLQMTMLQFARYREHTYYQGKFSYCCNLQYPTSSMHSNSVDMSGHFQGGANVPMLATIS